MFYNYKLLFLILIFLFQKNFVFGQEESSPKKFDKVGAIFSGGVYYPMSLNNNLAGDAFSIQPGVSFSFLGRFPDHNILLGGSYSYFGANIKESAIPRVGNYKRTATHLFMAEAGYIFWEKEHWFAYVKGGVGRVTYRNKLDNEDFKDTGIVLALSPNLGYRFHKNFAVYSSVSYRHDFLKIKAPDEIKNFFKHQDYLAVQVGVMFIF